MTDVALACDLAVETGEGTQLVRVMHGHQFDQYNAFDDPRSPVDTPLGHHVVRQVLPKLASRDQPGSLLEGVRWCNGDPSAFLGSRLLYRMVAGWLWWLAVPFAAALVLRFLSFAPGVKPLLHHHAERWLVWFGILVIAIAVIAAVTGIATMLRVNRALAGASVSERGDASAHNATVRAEAARLISAGYAGLITGHTHEPELSQVGGGFYANTGCATEVVRARKARFGLPAPFLAVRRLSALELTAGPVLSASLSLAERPIGRPSVLERLVLAPERARPETLEVVGRLPDGAVWPISERALMPWVRRRRVRRVAAFGLLAAGLLNIVCALASPVRWTRPVDAWLPFGVHPVSGVTAVIGGLALAGVVRAGSVVTPLTGPGRSWCNSWAADRRIHALDDGPGPSHPVCCRLRVIAVCGGNLGHAATDAVMGADRMPYRGRDLDLGIFAPSREVTGEERLGPGREQLCRG